MPCRQGGWSNAPWIIRTRGAIRFAGESLTASAPQVNCNTSISFARTLASGMSRTLNSTRSASGRHHAASGCKLRTSNSGIWPLKSFLSFDKPIHDRLTPRLVEQLSNSIQVYAGIDRGQIRVPLKASQAIPTANPTLQINVAFAHLSADWPRSRQTIAATILCVKRFCVKSTIWDLNPARPS